MLNKNNIKKMYKVTLEKDDQTNSYYNNLMQAIDIKQKMKKRRKDGFMYHIFEKIPGHKEWFKLE
jgi:hypothetical protein